MERSKFIANSMGKQDKHCRQPLKYLNIYIQFHSIASSLGAAVTMPICGYLISSSGWECVFYATGESIRNDTKEDIVLTMLCHFQVLLVFYGHSAGSHLPTRVRLFTLVFPSKNVVKLKRLSAVPHLRSGQVTCHGVICSHHLLYGL